MRIILLNLIIHLCFLVSLFFWPLRLTLLFAKNFPNPKRNIIWFVRRILGYGLLLIYFYVLYLLLIRNPISSIKVSWLVPIKDDWSAIFFVFVVANILSLICSNLIMRMALGRSSRGFFSVGALHTHGSARFSKPKEQKHILNENHDGLVIDGVRRISTKLSCQNFLLVAPTGVGKTQSFILPNLLKSCNYSRVVTDPAGEVFAKTSAFLQAQGYNILTIKPYDLDNTSFYNPLQTIKTISAAKIVSKTIVGQLESQNDPFWHIAAANMLAALILLLVDMSTPLKNYRNFANIKRLLIKPEDYIIELSQEIGSETTKEEIAQAFVGSEKTVNSIKTTLLSAIELFSDEHYRELTSSHNLDFTDLRAKKTVLYIIVPEEKIRTSSAFLSLFYKQLFEYLLSNSEGYPVFVLLEEFANSGYIPDFEQIITVARKKNISISLVVQELEQIEKLYEGKLETIISGGCQNKLFYSGLGVKTCDYVSKLLGDQTIGVPSISTGNESSSITQSFTARRLLNPDEVRQLGKDMAIFVTGNHPPIATRILPVYQMKDFQAVLDANKNIVAKLSCEQKAETVLIE